MSKKKLISILLLGLLFIPAVSAVNVGLSVVVPDTTPASGVPVINITFPANNSVNTTGFVNVTVMLNRTGTATLNWEGVNESMLPAGTGTSFYKNKIGLLSKNYTFKVYANDSSGGSNVSETRIVTVNRTTVNATIGTIINTSTFITNTALEIAAPSGNVTVTIPNGTNASVGGAALTSISIDSMAQVNCTYVQNLSSTYKFAGENLTLGPEGARFSPDIQIRFYYTDAQLTAAGIDESTLVVQFYNTTSNQWEALTTYLCDTTLNYTIVNVSHFSTFALLGTTAANLSGYKRNETSAGLQGWKIMLLNMTGSEIANTTTNADGYYKFVLPNGSYNVTEEMKEGWMNISAAYQIITIAGADITNVDFTNKPMPVLTSITVSPPSKTLIATETQTFTASPLDQYGYPITVEITWSSSNTSVGTINASGLFTAVSEGTTTVNATNGSVVGSASVTVTTMPPILGSIEVSPSTASLTVGETQLFNATAKDQYGNVMADINIAWTSISTVGTASPEHAITGSDGNASTTFTALAAGTTMVNATNGTLVGSASVTVSPAPPRLVIYTISNRTIKPPQSTEIDVEFSQTVIAWIKIEESNGDIVKQLYYNASVENPDPQTWNGTYANGTQVPGGSYYVNVTCTNTTTELSVINNTEIIRVTGGDLLPTAIKPYHYEWWEQYNVPKGDPWFNLTNYVNVTVKNNGSGSAAGFKVRLYADAELIGEKTIGGLAPGSSTDVKFEWKPTGKDPLSWSDTPYGSKITYTTTDKTYNLTAKVDEANEVPEENENEVNNNLTRSQIVVWNGYTGDEPLQNYIRGGVKGGMFYSTGNGDYQGVGSPGATYGTYYNVSYNLEIPGTPKLSRLYIYYTWAQAPAKGPKIGVTLTTPSGAHTLSMDKGYNDYKGEYGAWRYPWGTYAYNITDYVTTGGAYEVSITNLNDGTDAEFATKYAFGSPAILTVYENSSMPMREYWINEGADILLGGRRGDGGSLAWWECMNNATFPGSINLNNATLGLVSPWGEALDCIPCGNVLYFNDIELGRQVFDNGWNAIGDISLGGIRMTGSGAAQVGVNLSDVTSYLATSSNRVTQADDGDNMMSANAFLLVEVAEVY